jgi:hypothetical protein
LSKQIEAQIFDRTATRARSMRRFTGIFAEIQRFCGHHWVPGQKRAASRCSPPANRSYFMYYGAGIEALSARDDGPREKNPLPRPRGVNNGRRQFAIPRILAHVTAAR